MALSFAEVKNILDQNIGSLTAVTVTADASNRGASSTTSSNGLVIKRNGQVTGSLTGGTITLEGGGINWEGALSQDNAAPYFTRAQRTMLASILSYIGSMSDATVDNQVNQR
jgi:hypothetical protein